MGLIGKISAPLSWLLKRQRGPYRSVLDKTKPKRRAEALAWAAAHYPDERVQKIAARVVLILENQLNVSIKQLTPPTRFIEDLMVDEEFPELFMAIEEEFQIPEIQVKDCREMRVIDDLIRCLSKPDSYSPPPASLPC